MKEEKIKKYNKYGKFCEKVSDIFVISLLPFLAVIIMLAFLNSSNIESAKAIIATGFSIGLVITVVALITTIIEFRMWNARDLLLYDQH